MKKKVIVFIILFILLILLSIISFLHLKNIENEELLSNETNDNVENLSTSIFSIDKIILFSSADAIVNKNQRPLWDLNIYAYTNIGIYLKNDTDVKKIYLDNFNNSNYYYKPPEDFGTGKFTEEDLIVDIKEYDDTLITLSYITKDLTKNYIIPNSDKLVFDGTLLKRAGIELDSIDAKISFSIHIITSTDEHYSCPISIDLILEDDEKKESIYNGHILENIENPNYLFWKEN